MELSKEKVQEYFLQLKEKSEIAVNNAGLAGREHA